jgi:hypothetical protein
MDAEHAPDRVFPILNTLARNIGRLLGTEIGVMAFGEGAACNLMFVDDLGDVIEDGDSAVLCATKEEVENGAFLQLFAGRALYAAATRKFKLLGA